MLAFNRIGNSSFTVQSTVLTDDEKKNVWIHFKFLFLSIAVLCPACLIILCWRYRQARKNVPNNSPRRNSHPAQGVAIGNDTNMSANRDDVYSSIDSRRQILDKQLVTYKVTGKDKGGNKSDCENINQRRNRNRKHDSTKLNYIEIAFDPVTIKREFQIHGADNRTPYADIDFTAKADPIISSDESEDSSSLNENNENDFVSLEDVQQWNIHIE
ncbi:uncharacterized protein LOC127711079 [Mytilus californianus]|uniref:uncharacterized protein LOC127711079 n=1 Tax=Mytilus californianus TaxID=6549 RepID=UPI002246123B|nr:uncharacterized protein LOC127711079 [Mytilus californianus]